MTPRDRVFETKVLHDTDPFCPSSPTGHHVLRPDTLTLTKREGKCRHCQQTIIRAHARSSAWYSTTRGAA